MPSKKHLPRREEDRFRRIRKWDDGFSSSSSPPPPAPMPPAEAWELADSGRPLRRSAGYTGRRPLYHSPPPIPEDYTRRKRNVSPVYRRAGRSPSPPPRRRATYSPPRSPSPRPGRLNTRSTAPPPRTRAFSHSPPQRPRDYSPSPLRRTRAYSPSPPPRYRLRTSKYNDEVSSSSDRRTRRRYSPSPSPPPPRPRARSRDWDYRSSRRRYTSPSPTRSLPRQRERERERNRDRDRNRRSKSTPAKGSKGFAPLKNPRWQDAAAAALQAGGMAAVSQLMAPGAWKGEKAARVATAALAGAAGPLFTKPKEDDRREKGGGGGKRAKVPSGLVQELGGALGGFIVDRWVTNSKGRR
ncbi:hypothetical protein C8A03DRAFT_37643 [Achaetomium macrosporum]|uniref:Uncharacterized protein n=1 Tax=Achaetomium macrosporum TaxID=79813 RepID=A0AAN7C404_9PEZI|nr:hypothetical protein C8A03DRAFT_37643 [Achaetomium macrosporum]